MDTFSFPTNIFCGVGARTRIAELLLDARVSSPLIVTDRTLASLEPVSLIKEQVPSAAVFSEVWGNPTVSQAVAGAEAFKAGSHDGIVAVGGGAPLDIAKCIALLAHHPGELLAYEDGKPDALPVDSAIPYVVAIPTTAGTGSEVGRSAVVSDDDTKVKKIIYSPRLLANAVILDAELTQGLPAGVTAATGMDAITHLAEAYLAKGYRPMCDGIAIEGLRIASRNLEKAVSAANESRKDGAALCARQGMLVASMMGAVAFQKGLGVTHSCAHALSTVCDLHHGLANALMISACMRYYADAVPERMADLARACGTDDFPSWTASLNQTLSVPSGLSAVGVNASHLDQLVTVAMNDVCHPLGPKPVTAANVRALFEESM